MLQQEDIGVSRKVSTMFVLSWGTGMLIGLTGRNASGKSTIVDWFSKKGLKTASCSDSIRTWLAAQNIEPTRDALIEGGRELRRQGGAGILAEMLLEMLDGENDSSTLVGWIQGRFNLKVLGILYGRTAQISHRRVCPFPRRA